MSMDAASKSGTFSRFEQLRFARDVIRVEGQTLLDLANRIQDEFCDAVDCLLSCRGRVVVTGMGKAGLIGQKIAATLASTGTSSHFLHPAEAIHGDLGRLHQDDVVLALSFSGETEEMVRLLPSITELRIPMVAITGKPGSSLGASAHITLDLGPIREACSLGLAPSTSTTAMLGLGDALALVLSRVRGFAREDFARFHPGGSLGRKLSKVDEVMRPLAECRLAFDSQPIRQVIIETSKPGRRTGAIMLTNQSGRLTGVFTDSDLARMLETNDDGQLDLPVHEVMTRDPKAIAAGSLLSAAVQVLAESKISELPVVNDQSKPVGLVDITDVVAWLPADKQAENSHQSAEPLPGEHPKTVPFPNQADGKSRI